MSIELKWPFRPEQEEILDAFKLSCEEEVRFLLVDAPTGVGKSYAAMAMAKHWWETKRGKVDVITNSKMLQSQYLKDFPFLAELKGKSNYLCSRFATNCSEGSELSKQEKESCLMCPHQIAYEKFITSQVSMINFHLFCSYSVFAPHVLRQRGSSMLIIDEAHGFEEVYTEFISLVLSKRVLQGLGLEDKPAVVERMQKINNSEDMEKFFKGFFEERILSSIREQTDLANKVTTTKAKSRHLQNIKRAERFLLRFNRFLNDPDRNRWVFQKKKVDPQDRDGVVPHISLEPIWGRKYLWDFIWSKFDKVVFMSATILDPKIFSFLNGLNEPSLYCTVNSPFPVDNRLVQYAPVGRMSYKYKEHTIKNMIPRIERILQKNPEDKGIIHTGNYENSRKLQKALGHNRRLIFHGSGDAPIALKKHENSREPTVLVSPAMTHGVDLKDELSRLQILMKVPFPSLGDERIKRRLQENQRWYAWRTWIEVVQSCGRSIRNKEDWANTYVLDSSFNQLLRQSDLIPTYFKEALVRPK